MLSMLLKTNFMFCILVCKKKSLQFEQVYIFVVWESGKVLFIHLAYYGLSV